MTLSKLIKKLNKEGFDGNVYIGGKQGSGFFYIGPYDVEEIQKKYDACDKEIRRQSAETEVEFRNLMSKPINKNVKDIQLMLAVADDIAKLAARTRKYLHYKEVYTKSINDAPVINHYAKTDPNEPGMIIILDGCQIGKFWIKSEYDERKRA